LNDAVYDVCRLLAFIRLLGEVPYRGCRQGLGPQGWRLHPGLAVEVWLDKKFVNPRVRGIEPDQARLDAGYR
jgi:hypothetical protein